MSAITVHEVDPHDDAAFRAWYAAFHDGVTAGRTAPLCESYDALAASLRNPSSRKRRVAVAAREGAVAVGGMLLEYHLEHDLDVVDVEIAVPEPQRRRGAGGSLWDHATARAAELGRGTFCVELNVPAGRPWQDAPGGRFAASRGFTSEHVEDHYARAWPVPHVPAATDPAYELLTWTGATPEEHLEAYAAMQTAMSADVPTGNLTREARTITVDQIRESDQRLLSSYRVYVALAVTTAQRRPAGYTLVFVDRSNPVNGLQDDTLVLQEHRGHGLGAALKAANYAQMSPAESALRRLHTWTAQSNDAMRTVNARFGFEVAEVMHELERRPR
ncbi:GNAT family N-acetyltransferase [Luteipulveratus flavus]|uniref:N-acetyltransferase domain-containing protein n=1 Tax=Luteipulveratus flavus TaxID=3031728 RepID=A0ABT6C3R8_9MICO|nr:hypothetical protein [Luteipulveratus sp. YIM 133296]MDF8263203.1 hypothetical protein [Luteipulveratus sp. YIM 133296]